MMESLCQIDVFMEAAFTAVCKDIKFLQTKLSAQSAESSGNITPTNEETLNHLCQQCESSLKFLHSLCQQKLLRERIVKNKVFSQNTCFSFFSWIKLFEIVIFAL